MIGSLNRSIKRSASTKFPNLPDFRHIPTVPLFSSKNSDETIELHPDVFAIEHPDIRLIKKAVTWQETYKLVDMTHRVRRLENFGSTERPWGRNIGRTRRKDEQGQASIFGTTKEAFSGPWSMWSEFSEDQQCQALISALTVKYAQGDLIVFDDHSDLLEIRKSYGDEPNNQHLHVLSIIGDIIVPQEFMQKHQSFYENSKYDNVLPITGLNTLSILAHEKLQLHVSTVKKIESRLLSWSSRYPVGNYDDFEESERHVFYKDSQHVEARAHFRNPNTVLDQVEADGKSYKYKNQHDFGKYFDGADKWKEQIIRGD